MRVALSCFIALLCASTPSAQQGKPPAGRAETGAEWLDRCGDSIRTGDPKGLEAMLTGVSCLGWVSGLVDLNTTIREVAPNAPATFCLPTGGTRLADVAKSIVTHVEKNKADQSKPIRVLAHQALLASFPCRA